jgi:hypothetical protein
MTSEQNALDLITETLLSLQRAGLINKEVTFGPDTILLGPGSALDSLAFVTFIAEAEDKLNRLAGRELSLMLNEIHDFNTDSSRLTADVLARYVAKLISGS